MTLQELFKLEDTYPHLLCLRPLEPASLDTLASQHPCYDTFVRVKAPLVWHMLRGFVSTELIHAALAAVISAAEEPSPDGTVVYVHIDVLINIVYCVSCAAPAFSDATPDVLPSLAPVLSREESDSGITPAVHAGSVKLSHIRSIGVSTDALIEYLCAEGSEDDAGYIRRFASEVRCHLLL